jgi:hypothetical protein
MCLPIRRGDTQHGPAVVPPVKSSDPCNHIWDTPGGLAASLRKAVIPI